MGFYFLKAFELLRLMGKCVETNIGSRRDKQNDFRLKCNTF